MDTPIILAIDGATHLGYAYGRAGEPPISGSVACGKPGSSRGAIFSNAGRWITSFLSENAADLLAIEAPLPGTFVSGKTTRDTAEILFGLPAVLEFMAYQVGVFRHYRVNQSSVKKHFVGVGKGNQKAAVRAKCIALGWVGLGDEDQSDDRTDALSVWSYAEMKWAPKIAQPVDPIFVAAQRRKGIAA